MPLPIIICFILFSSLIIFICALEFGFDSKLLTKWMWSILVINCFLGYWIIMSAGFNYSSSEPDKIYEIVTVKFADNSAQQLFTTDKNIILNINTMFGKVVSDKEYVVRHTKYYSTYLGIDWLGKREEYFLQKVKQ